MDIKQEIVVNSEDCGSWWQNFDDDEFQSVFRVSRKTLIELQAEIDYLENFRKDRIETALMACLWFLGNNEPLNNVTELFNIDNPESFLEAYLKKVLKLGTMYIMWPEAKEAVMMEKGFRSQYGFPNLIGVIGSLHIEVNVDEVTNPKLYFNKLMGKSTVVLQVVCDHNLLLRDVCVGCPGGIEIKSILESSPLYSILTSDDNDLVKNDYCLLGGTEHPKLKTLLTPYEFDTFTEHSKFQYAHNVKHNSVMKCIENTFSHMENRFPRLTSVDDLNPAFAALVVGCICVLHNFTRVRNDNCDLYL